jgi:hypothetical protein
MTRVVAALAAALLAPGLASAQAERQAECARILRAPAGPESCGDLAYDVVIGLGEGLLRDPADAPGIMLRDLQPADEGSASAAGSLAQSEAVPGTRPMAIGGGSLTAVGSDAGADAITALTLNPSIFFGGDESGERVAQQSRLADLTAYVPMNDLDRDDDGDVDYFGLHVRVNFTGLAAGSELWSAAARLQDVTEVETAAAERLREELNGVGLARLEACVALLRDSGAEATAVVQSCGDDIRPDLDLPTYEEFRASLIPLRERADSRYFGLDVRLDVGDPTLGAVADAEAVSINGGVAFGKQFVGTDALSPSAGVRLRAGIRYTDLARLDESSFALDGGLAFVLRRPVDFEKALTVSGGVEFRFGGVDDALEGAMQSEFLTVRAALSVPVTDQTAITLGFGQPLLGTDISQTLSVTADWRLLLPLLPVG